MSTFRVSETIVADTARVAKFAQTVAITSETVGAVFVETRHALVARFASSIFVTLAFARSRIANVVFRTVRITITRF